MAEDSLQTEGSDNGAETVPPPENAARGSGARHSWSRGDVLALVVVVLAALAVRAVYISQQQSAADFGKPVGDAEFFDTWARTFAGGERLTDGPYYRAPLYSWVLGATYKVAGFGPLAPRIVQAVLGALTCGLLFVIGRQLFSRVVGLVAGLAAGSYWILVFFTGELLIPTLATFLDVLLLWLLIEAHRRKCLGCWAASGIVLGLSAIARPNILLFAPVILVWALMVRSGRRDRVLTGVTFTVACLIPVLPITVRNCVVGGDCVLISSQGGVNLYIGNNPESDGVNVLLPGTRPHWHDTYLDQIAIAERAEGRSLKPSEVSRYYLRQTWEFVREQPRAAAGLLYTKLTCFWNRHEFSNNKDIYDYTSRYAPFTGYLPLGFGVVGPLGLLGLITYWPRRRELFPLWGFLLVYMISVVLFFSSARFRVPVVPVLILYGAAGCVWIVGTIGRRRWRSLVEASVFLALAAVFCNAQQEDRSVPGLWHLTTAAMLAEKGEIDQAIAEYEKAIAEYPGNHEAFGDMASLYLLRGQFVVAERAARRAVELNPGYAKGLDVLGAVIARQGRIEESLSYFRRSVASVPHNAQAQQHLGHALLLQGRLAEAAKHLGRAAELEPDRADTQASLGMLAVGQGDAGKAVEHLRRSLSLDPSNPQALGQLAEVLQSQGQAAEAARVLGEGLERRPNSTFLTMRLARLLLTTTDPAVRDPDEAVRLAEGVSQRDGGRDPRTQHTLAAAYAVAGRCEDAVNVATSAIPLAEQAGLPQIAQQLRALIQRCTEGRLPDIRDSAGRP